MPPPHPTALDDEHLQAQCELTFTRRSGPGGQHRNKTSTAVVLKHLPTGVTAEANERRSQAENRRQALARLRVRLALLVRSPLSPEDPVSDLWQSRSRGGRLAINPEHADFAPMLAEALDRLQVNDWQVGAVTEQLACTATQLYRFLKLCPPAFAILNLVRKSRGLRPLK